MYARRCSSAPLTPPSAPRQKRSSVVPRCRKLTQSSRAAAFRFLPLLSDPTLCFLFSAHCSLPGAVLILLRTHLLHHSTPQFPTHQPLFSPHLSNNSPSNERVRLDPPSCTLPRIAILCCYFCVRFYVCLLALSLPSPDLAWSRNCLSSHTQTQTHTHTRKHRRRTRPIFLFSFFFVLLCVFSSPSRPRPVFVF